MNKSELEENMFNQRQVWEDASKQVMVGFEWTFLISKSEVPVKQNQSKGTWLLKLN